MQEYSYFLFFELNTWYTYLNNRRQGSRGKLDG